MENEKEVFEMPEMDVVSFESEDVITTSCGDDYTYVGECKPV